MIDLRVRSIGGIAVALLALGATASAASGPVMSAPAVEPPVAALAIPAAPAAVPVVATMTERMYLATIKGLLGHDRVTQSDADYLQGGKDICAEIAAGATWDTFAQQIDNLAGGNYEFYRPAIGAAVYTFCPDDAGILP